MLWLKNADWCRAKAQSSWENENLDHYPTIKLQDLN